MTCKGCETLLNAGQVDVASLVAEQVSLESAINIVEPELFASRQQHCENCPFMQAKTCLKCGCYYEFRAQLKNKNCPIGQW